MSTETPEIPAQLQNADWSHTYEGLRIWELGDEGGHVIAFGHIAKQWLASAILSLSAANHDDPIGKAWLTDIRHTTGHIRDTPGDRFDFVVDMGEGLDFKVTEWRIGSGEPTNAPPAAMADDHEAAALADQGEAETREH